MAQKQRAPRQGEPLRSTPVNRSNLTDAFSTLRRTSMRLTADEEAPHLIP